MNDAEWKEHLIYVYGLREHTSKIIHRSEKLERMGLKIVGGVYYEIDKKRKVENSQKRT